MNDTIRMQVSAFVDGELPENEAEMLLRRMSQDVELRREVAEYLALSRLIKGEAGLAGADRLHKRVSAEIDHRPAEEMGVSKSAAAHRAMRPLAVAAVAAAVALLGIIGLQQSNDVGDADVSQQASSGTAVVPDAESQQEQQRRFFLNHANASSALGANGMNTRLVTLQFSEEVAEDFDSAEQERAEEEKALQDKNDTTTTNRSNETATLP